MTQIHPLATEVHRCYDEWGPIYVLQQGEIRYLAFGDGGEQSAVDLNRPYRPLYEYAQAMLLALLFQPNPQQVLMLGLGGGSLATALLRALPDCRITAVELRAQVVETAHHWFALPRSERLHCRIEDAAAYMAHRPASCELLFADIYLDDGMQEVQLSSQLLADCHHALADDGILVLNLWDDGRARHPLALQRLSEHFGDALLGCPIEGGNLIAFAFKGGLPNIQPRRLQKPLKQLGRQLELPLQKLLNKLGPL
ncbi:methyltransferase [Marinobacterium arenosum]|uniref:methyltransferase n=1 Tax=Marinobacterium arenosum TaxID=2862496 RepID=UPI001C94C741|nr:methyltransferase [Marinobacterium arenosum]MBY4675748.1 methyltransferase [Marinobacterium arenosum]